MGGEAGKGSLYCVCHDTDEGFMVECSDGTGGCGGWFHPECCNLDLSEEQRKKSEGYARATVSLVHSMALQQCSQDRPDQFYEP